MRSQISPPMLMPVRSSGHYVVGNNWRQAPKIGTFLELFWITAGCCEFTFKGVPVPVQSKEVCFFFPGDEHLQHALQDNTDFWWMCIDGDYVSDIIDAYKLKRLPTYAGECPMELFSQLYECLECIDISSQYKASSIAMNILNLARSACNPNPAKNTIVEDFMAICKTRYNDPDINVEIISDIMKLHRSTLHRIFMQNQGQSPKQYLTNFRMQKAIGLLLNTRMRIAQISTECGFAQENYFIKVFRAHQGKTPGEFRREHSASV